MPSLNRAQVLSWASHRNESLRAFQSYHGAKITAGWLKKTEPMKKRPTTLKELEELVMETAPVKFAGSVTSSSRNLAEFDRAGTDIAPVTTGCPEEFNTVSWY